MSQVTDERLNARYADGWYYCWLIEWRDGPQPKWLGASTWVTEANEAIWYARKSDADSVWAHDLKRTTKVVVCEHGFDLRLRTAPSPDAMREALQIARNYIDNVGREYAQYMDDMDAGAWRATLKIVDAALTPQPASSAPVWTAEQIAHVEAEASELLAKAKQLPAAVESDAKPVKRWPFVESPGEFADRLTMALNDFNGYVLGAVRNVLIENPPQLEHVFPDTDGRYRWLRSKMRATFDEDSPDEPQLVWLKRSDPYIKGDAERLDAAIDSQLAREKL